MVSAGWTLTLGARLPLDFRLALVLPAILGWGGGGGAGGGSLNEPRRVETRRTLIVNSWPAVTPWGNSTVKRPAKFAPDAGGIGTKVKPLGTVHWIVLASDAESWFVE